MASTSQSDASKSTYIYCNVYQYNIAAVQKLREEFCTRAGMRSIDARLHYDENKNLFILQCSSELGEELNKILLHLLPSFTARVEASSADGDDDFPNAVQAERSRYALLHLEKAEMLDSSNVQQNDVDKALVARHEIDPSPLIHTTHIVLSRISEGQRAMLIQLANLEAPVKRTLIFAPSSATRDIYTQHRVRTIHFDKDEEEWREVPHVYTASCLPWSNVEAEFKRAAQSPIWTKASIPAVQEQLAHWLADVVVAPDADPNSATVQDLPDIESSHQPFGLHSSEHGLRSSSSEDSFASALEIHDASSPDKHEKVSERVDGVPKTEAVAVDSSDDSDKSSEVSDFDVSELLGKGRTAKVSQIERGSEENYKDRSRRPATVLKPTKTKRKDQLAPTDRFGLRGDALQHAQWNTNLGNRPDDVLPQGQLYHASWNEPSNSEAPLPLRDASWTQNRVANVPIDYGPALIDIGSDESFPSLGNRPEPQVRKEEEERDLIDLSEDIVQERLRSPSPPWKLFSTMKQQKKKPKRPKQPPAQDNSQATRQNYVTQSTLPSMPNISEPASQARSTRVSNQHSSTIETIINFHDSEETVTHLHMDFGTILVGGGDAPELHKRHEDNRMQELLNLHQPETRFVPYHFGFSNAARAHCINFNNVDSETALTTEAPVHSFIVLHVSTRDGLLFQIELDLNDLTEFKIFRQPSQRLLLHHADRTLDSQATLHCQCEIDVLPQALQDLIRSLRLEFENGTLRCYVVSGEIAVRLMQHRLRYTRHLRWPSSSSQPQINVELRSEFVHEFQIQIEQSQEKTLVTGQFDATTKRPGSHDRFWLASLVAAGEHGDRNAKYHLAESLISLLQKTTSSISGILATKGSQKQLNSHPTPKSGGFKW